MLEEPEDTNKVHDVKLTDITRGLYHAASSTYSMVANQYISLLSQYFDEAADGTYIPKTVDVQLPDESKITIPLVSLVAPKGLMLDKVNFDFAVIADPSHLAAATMDLNKLDNLTRSSFKVEMTSQNHHPQSTTERSGNGEVGISMQFTSIEPPEGLMRFFDKFASLVTPLKSVTPISGRPLLTPHFLHIITYLETNEDVARQLEHFNENFRVDVIFQKSQEIKLLENELQKKHLAIERERKNVRDQFKQTYEYARIVFEGSFVFEKLLLTAKISSSLREWLPLASKFYATILADEHLAEKLQSLEKPDAMASSATNRLQHEYSQIKNLEEKLVEYNEMKATFSKESEWLRKFTSIAKSLFKNQPEVVSELFPELPDY